MSRSGFDYFVVLAGMRTGSNLLEEHLAAMPGLRVHGELFNPHFFGKPKIESLFGLSLDERDAEPLRVLEAMQAESDDLPGFRLFYDHDQRVIEHVLKDERAAKIILSRRPLDSYVSLKIARQTGQWWLGDLATARTAKVAFDVVEYAEFMSTLGEFQDRVRRALQITGQTAFHIDYADLSDDDVIAGLGRYLGAKGPPDADKVRAKVQNPRPIADRLTNAADAELALKDISLPDLGHIPSHEPERGPGLRLFHVCRSVGLMYMPIRGAGTDPVPEWMRQLDPDAKVESGLTQKQVRRWMRERPGHRSFSILRHPLPRAYSAFCRCVFPENNDVHADIRHVLQTRYGVPLPLSGSVGNWSLERHREAFHAFLVFLEGNLGGQTALRVDHAWATQSAYLGAVARFVVPDRVIREDAAAQELGELATTLGLKNAPVFAGTFDPDVPYPLDEVCTPEIEEACRAAYRRDYVFFGFDRWRS